MEINVTVKATAPTTILHKALTVSSNVLDKVFLTSTGETRLSRRKSVHYCPITKTDNKRLQRLPVMSARMCGNVRSKSGEVITPDDHITART